MDVDRCQGCVRFAVLLGAFLAVPSGRASAGDWPQFRGPARDGISNETGLVDSWSKEGPPQVWAKKIGLGYSGPVVAGDRVIVFSRDGDKEVVQCLAAATGKERWKYVSATAYQDDYGKGDGPRATPVIAGSQVFTLGPSGTLTCLELATGKKVWSRPLNEDYAVRKNFFGVGTTPLVEGNLVLVNVGGKGAGIVALARDTGKEVWRASDDAASYSSPVAVTVGGARRVVFFTREGIVVLDPARGTVVYRKRWRARMNASVNAATPVVAGDLLFISASYETGAIVLRIKKDGAEELWKSDDVLSNHYETSIFHDGYLYGFDGRQELGARMRCVEMKTGKVRWTKEGFGCGSMVLAEGKLFILTEGGDLVLVRATPEAYRELARARLLQRPCRAPLALAHGRLYLRDDRQVICLDVKRGK